MRQKLNKVYRGFKKFAVLLLTMLIVMPQLPAPAFAVVGQSSIEVDLQMSGGFQWGLDESGKAEPEVIPEGSSSQVTFPITVTHELSFSGTVKVSVPTAEYDAQISQISVQLFRHGETGWEPLKDVHQQDVFIAVPANPDKVGVGQTVNYPINAHFDPKTLDLSDGSLTEIKATAHVTVPNSQQGDYDTTSTTFNISGDSRARLKAVGLSADNGLELSQFKVDGNTVNNSTSLNNLGEVKGGEKFQVTAQAKGLIGGYPDAKSYQVYSEAKLVPLNADGPDIAYRKVPVTIRVTKPEPPPGPQEYVDVNFQAQGTKNLTWSLEHTGSPQSQELEVGQQGTTSFDVTVRPEPGLGAIFSGSVTISVPADANTAKIKDIFVNMTNVDPTWSWQLEIGESSGQEIQPGQSKTFSFNKVEEQVLPSVVEKVMAQATVILQDDKSFYSKEQQVNLNYAENGLAAHLVGLPEGLTMNSLKVDGVPIVAGFNTVPTNTLVANEQKVYHVEVGFTADKAGTYYIEHIAGLTNQNPIPVKLEVKVYSPELAMMEFGLNGFRDVDWQLTQQGDPPTQELKVGQDGMANFKVTVTGAPQNTTNFGGGVSVSVPEGAKPAVVNKIEVELKGDGDWSYTYNDPITGDQIQPGDTADYALYFEVPGLPLSTTKLTAKANVYLENGQCLTKEQDVEVILADNNLKGNLIKLPDGLSQQWLKVDGQVVPQVAGLNTISDGLSASKSYLVQVGFKADNVGTYTVSHKAILGEDDPNLASVQVIVKGEVPPPPSDNTPPEIRITPEIVPAGDPTITIKPTEDLDSAYAILPDGRRIDLKLNAKSGVWKGSFMVPFGTPDGPYKISIFTINRQGISRHFDYTIIIDNSLPLIVLSPIQKDGHSISISAQVLFPASSLTAELGGKVVSLVNKQGTDRWSGTMEIPEDLLPGTYEITFVAKDTDGNCSVLKSSVTIENVSSRTVQTVAKVQDPNEPMVTVVPTPSEKARAPWLFPFGTTMAMGVVGLFLVRRRIKL